jgi:hypothetical protein
VSELLDERRVIDATLRPAPDDTRLVPWYPAGVPLGYRGIETTMVMLSHNF